MAIQSVHQVGGRQVHLEEKLDSISSKLQTSRFVLNKDASVTLSDEKKTLLLIGDLAVL